MVGAAAPATAARGRESATTPVARHDATDMPNNPLVRTHPTFRVCQVPRGLRAWCTIRGRRPTWRCSGCGPNDTPHTAIMHNNTAAAAVDSNTTHGNRGGAATFLVTHHLTDRCGQTEPAARWAPGRATAPPPTRKIDPGASGRAGWTARINHNDTPHCGVLAGGNHGEAPMQAGAAV